MWSKSALLERTVSPSDMQPTTPSTITVNADIISLVAWCKMIQTLITYVLYRDTRTNQDSIRCIPQALDTSSRTVNSSGWFINLSPALQPLSYISHTDSGHARVSELAVGDDISLYP